LVLPLGAKEHHFNTCPISNEPATTLVTIRFAFSSAASSWGLLAGLGWLWFLWLLQKRAKIQIPLSDNVIRRRKKHKKIYRILLTLTLCGILIPALLASLSEELINSVGRGFLTLFLCVFPALYFERKSRLFRCEAISNGYIYLSGANQEFLNTLTPIDSTMQ